jgi:predicted NBD/HSP70 family sugar kinase
VKEIAELAFQGNESAQAVFWKFGEQIGEGLGAIIGGLHPDAIAIGGAISKSKQPYVCKP